MQVQSTQQSTPMPSKPERALTRQERRIQERITNEAQSTFGRLATFYFNNFMMLDPDADEIKGIEKEVIAKWKTYCKHKNLIPEVYDALSKEIERIKTDYVSNKKES